MSVGDILKTKGASVETIARDATITEAVQRLRDNDIGALVVSADGKAVEGILSERDVVQGLADHGGSVQDLTVKDLMTSSVTTCSPEEGLEKVMLEMTELRARHFPVVDGERLVGIVSIGDVVKSRLEEVELERAVLRDTHIAAQ